MDTRKNLACEILRLRRVAIATSSLTPQCDPPEGFYIIRNTSFLLYKKIAQTPENTGFTPLILNERAEVRTPDNLIKSQVLYQLSYTPPYYLISLFTWVNWASWIRTSECRSQSPVPYRLAIAH